ncbi:MAG: leucine-rich repeat protein [Clostridia bacterium]|nr:leucine-rich repeat protein [Clostridia bacterium]
MKKFISILLVIVMVFSCVGVFAFADTTQYYRDGMYEFYIGSDGGAHIVNVIYYEAHAQELDLPFRLCFDDDKKVDSIKTTDIQTTSAKANSVKASGIEDDDNDAPDPFGANYAYVTALEAESLNAYVSTLKKISFDTYVSDIDIDTLRLEQLEEIVVDENNTTYSSSNGTLYSADGKKLILHPQHSSDNSILSTVTSFETKAFSDSTEISSITVPSGVTKIPDRCFEGCTALASIDMSNAKIGKIGIYAFLNTALTAVNLGAYIKLVDSFAFFGNSNLTSVTIPQEAKNVVLGAGSFIGCPIEELTVYRSIIEMNDKAIGFYYDDDFALQQYDNLVVTTYKYDEAMENTTAMYNYLKTNAIKFVPLDDIYDINIDYEQLKGYDAVMYLYKGSTKKYTVNSENGIFELQNIPRANYDAFFISKFGLAVKGTSINIQISDYKEQYNKLVLKHQPIGNVNGDNKIDINDIAALLEEDVYTSANADYDINMDGIVDFRDVSIILAKNNYGAQGETLPKEGTTPIIPI